MELDHASKEILENNGFKPYKKNQYVLIRDDMLFYLSFQGKKKDIYIWYAVYPLCLPNISFGSGWGKSAGRKPEKENELFINKETEISNVSKNLSSIVKDEYLPFITQIHSLKDIAEMYSPWHAAGFSFLALGEYKKGINYLKEYKKFKESLSEYSTVEKEIDDFINNAQEANIDSLLEHQRKLNISKLRLSRYI